MKKPTIGRKIRVIGNTNDHNYTMGGIYTVTQVDDSDETLKANDSKGNTGNWIRWKDVAETGGVGWDFIKKVLPADVIEFLGAFDNVETLELSGETKDTILLSLPDLHERILKATIKIKSDYEGEIPSQEAENNPDDIFK
jgi:hypothetical protein